MTHIIVKHFFKFFFPFSIQFINHIESPHMIITYLHEKDPPNEWIMLKMLWWRRSRGRKTFFLCWMYEQNHIPENPFFSLDFHSNKPTARPINKPNQQKKPAAAAEHCHCFVFYNQNENNISHAHTLNPNHIKFRIHTHTHSHPSTHTLVVYNLFNNINKWAIKWAEKPYEM